MLSSIEVRVLQRFSFVHSLEIFLDPTQTPLAHTIPVPAQGSATKLHVLRRTRGQFFCEHIDSRRQAVYTAPYMDRQSQTP